MLTRLVWLSQSPEASRERGRGSPQEVLKESPRSLQERYLQFVVQDRNISRALSWHQSYIAATGFASIPVVAIQTGFLQSHQPLQSDTVDTLSPCTPVAVVLVPACLGELFGISNASQSPPDPDLIVYERTFQFVLSTSGTSAMAQNKATSAQNELPFPEATA
ncbi:hypothetical protein ON010_g8103 [Phytophthora cinnamomi]|nr:hypothetical protein ON010_g8103 [Phytophthora cinnamomi]